MEVRWQVQEVVIETKMMLVERERETTNYRAEYNRFNSRGRGRGKFDKSPTVQRPRVASRTPKKDSIRCFYCKEHGHIIRHCLWRLEDEETGGKGPSLNMLEDQYVSNDDSTLWDDSGYSNHTSYNVLTDQQ